MKRILNEILPYAIILIVVVIIRTFIITPITVVGSSMDPTLHNGELLLLSKISYKLHDINRFDVVVIKEDDWIIKRIIGLPNENVSYQNGNLYINDKIVEDKYSDGVTEDFTLNDICNAGLSNKNNDFTCPFDKIPEGYYLVLGDNRSISKDSRSVGLIKADEIKGKAIVRFWPLNKISIVK